MQEFEFYSNSPAATLALGKGVGEFLTPGSVLGLTGELGCGKTLLTRGICAGLGVPVKQVCSPTFVLVNEYRGRMPVFHMDLYRLSGSAEVFEIGLADFLERAAAGAMIIEWAEKILPILPADLLKVEFDIISPRKRHIHFSSHSDKHVGVFRELNRR